MPFVLDCSVAMAWVFRDEATDATDRLRDMLGENRALVPALWPTETANALLAATRRKRIEREEWPRLRMQLNALPIDVDAVSTARTWGPVLDLAAVHGLTVYDATYLELVMRSGLPLATLDRALRIAAQAEGCMMPVLG